LPQNFKEKKIGQRCVLLFEIKWILEEKKVSCIQFFFASKMKKKFDQTLVKK
jgi:hypothetical protein